MVPLYVTVCPIICFKASSHCKSYIDALLWLNAEMLERVPIPLFVRLVRYSAHGCSFVRVRYIFHLTLISVVTGGYRTHLTLRPLRL